MASRAQWRFGIFAIGLQMAIKLNPVLLVYLRSLQFVFLKDMYSTYAD